MTYPRINAMFIVFYDETVAPIRLRFVDLDGVPHFLACDIGHYAGLKPDEDGDHRAALTDLNIPFVDSMVDDRGNVFGPVALIAQDSKDRLETHAAAVRAELQGEQNG